MATQPIDKILSPVQPKTKSILGQFGCLIDETRAFGTHVLQWHMDSAVGGDDVVPISLSIRHILELMGAVSSCVKNANIDPCKIVLRAMLESFLGLTYMLQNDTRRRAFAFLAVEAHQRLKHLRMLDLSTEEGKKYLSLVRDDENASSFSPRISPEMIATAINNAEEFLQTEGVGEALTEIINLKKTKKKRNPNWYSLYGGPANLEELATTVGHQLLYAFFYRYWSRSTHGIDVIQGKLGRSASGRPGIFQLEIPTDAQALTQITATLALATYRLVLTKYSPSKIADLDKWYQSEIRNMFMELTKTRLINVVMPT
jgi:hypothetical protein